MIAEPANNSLMSDVDWIRKGLEATGMQQNELARQIGVSETVMSRILSGKPKPRTLKAPEAWKIQSIFKARGINVGELMGTGDVPATVAVLPLSADLQENV